MATTTSLIDYNSKTDKLVARREHQKKNPLSSSSSSSLCQQNTCNCIQFIEVNWWQQQQQQLRRQHRRINHTFHHHHHHHATTSNHHHADLNIPSIFVSCFLMILLQWILIAASATVVAGIAVVDTTEPHNYHHLHMHHHHRHHNEVQAASEEVLDEKSPTLNELHAIIKKGLALNRIPDIQMVRKSSFTYKLSIIIIIIM